MAFATLSRRLHFVAGRTKQPTTNKVQPSTMFYACDEHRIYLEKGTSLFFVVPAEEIKAVDDFALIPCDFCPREWSER